MKVGRNERSAVAAMRSSQPKLEQSDDNTQLRVAQSDNATVTVTLSDDPVRRAALDRIMRRLLTPIDERGGVL